MSVPTTAVTTVVTTTSPASAAPTSPVDRSAVPARQMVELVEEIVRAVKPTPPESARIYAYATTAYADALDAGASSERAAVAVVQILRSLRPESVDLVDAAAARAGIDVDAGSPLDTSVAERLRNETITVARVPPEPSGDGLWVSKTGTPPLAPAAGGWNRWVVYGFEPEVPAPPQPGSAEQSTQLAVVRRAIAARDARWVDRINHWGGAPGTNTPAGIWLDEFWHEIADLPMAGDDHRVARVQSDLARTMADAFMETWKVKYTYWTARPDMVDPTLTTSMPDPNFPGYVSGHATVSAAAATVLAALVPEKSNVWIADAEEARDSRLMAGIHFPVDNEEGFRLGHAVGSWALAAFAADVPPAPEAGAVVPRPARLSIPAGVDAPVSAVDLAAPLADEVVGSGRLTLHPSRTSPGVHDGPVGVLLSVTKPGLDRSFLVASNGAEADRMTVGSGWKVTRLGTDRMWAPAACGGVPTAVVGDRWIAYAEATGDDAGHTSVRLVAFDTTTRTFTSYLPEPNDVAYYGAVTPVGDHQVDVLYGIPPAGEAPLGSTGAEIVSRVRRIDLYDGSYADLLPRPQVAQGVVDGISMRYGNGRPDVDLVRGDGVVVASVHGYRTATLFGWTAPLAYMSGMSGDSAEHPGTVGVGVYDSRATSWDWGLVAAPDTSMLTLGTITR